jgi:hypothetical protein
MWAISRPNRRSFLALILFGAVVLTAVAMADPMTPSKVKTIRILSQPAEDHSDQPPSPAKSTGVHLLTVRPKLPDEHRDASGRELSTTQGRGNASGNADVHAVPTIAVRPAPDAHGSASGSERLGPQGIVSGIYDPHRVRTMTVRPEPGVTSEPNYNFVPATPVPSQAAPQ